MDAIELQLFLAAAPGRVFEAWTKPELLCRWWGPGATAEVDLRVGGSFRLGMEFDGGPLVAAGEYREVLPGERLSFTWAWEGEEQPESLVTLTLEKVEGGTELRLHHEGLQAASAENHKAGWQDCIERLGGLTPQLDWEIRFETYIEASPAKVWRAVESQELVRRWLGPRTEFEPGLGGRVILFDSSGEYRMGGEIIRWEPGRQMTFTWAQFEPSTHPATHFTFELIPQGEGTLVQLRHHYFLDVSEADFLDYKQGWGTGERQLAVIRQIATGD